ncbi:MAG: HD domain-containing protein [Bacteroidia bacterium]|nr:HD domain-containing protein [Bacteroidia bacterium]
MWKQEIYQQAIKFAGEKHADQKVPGSTANYLAHLSNVCMEILGAYKVEDSFDVNFAIQLALLHDVMEDTPTTFEEIKEVFGKKVALGVEALTKNEDLPKAEAMKDSLKRINEMEKEVGMVKLADRITNLQEPPTYWRNAKRMSYWQEAGKILDSLSGKHDYLWDRLKDKIEDYAQYIKM